MRHVAALLRPGGSAERLHGLRGQAWSVERADLADLPALQALLRRLRPRAVLHLALDGGVYRHGPSPATEAANPLQALFEGIADVPGARVVHTSSAWVLRPGEGLDESAPLEPRSPYSLHKADEDRRLPELARRTGVPFVNLRLFNIFGKHEQHTRLLPYLVASLAAGQAAKLSHGEQVRDFNDVDTIAKAYLRALMAPDDACGAVYHVGSGRATTVREFAAMVAEVTGHEQLIRFDASATPDQEIACLVADPTRARQTLGWSPDPDLRQSVQRAARWWLARLPTIEREVAS